MITTIIGIVLILWADYQYEYFNRPATSGDIYTALGILILVLNGIAARRKK